MIELEGAVKYFPVNDSSYELNLTYSAKRYKDSEGDLSAIELRPDFSGDSASINSDFILKYPSGRIPLLPSSNKETFGGEGSVSFVIHGSAEWFVVPALIKFSDKSGHQLAATQIPVYVLDP